MHKYEDLIVYQKALVYARTVRLSTKTFPKEELYSLTSQYRRAVDSIVLNIAEGAGNYSNKEFARFLTYSIRSGFECKGCVDIALTNDYVTEEIASVLKNDANEIIAMLDSLYHKINQYFFFLVYATTLVVFSIVVSQLLNDSITQLLNYLNTQLFP